MKFSAMIPVALVAALAMSGPLSASGGQHLSRAGRAPAAEAAPERHAPAGHAAAAQHASPVQHAAGLHWSYDGQTGPDHWGELSSDFRLCKTGRMQSPVDLGGAEIPGKFSVKATYRPGPLTVLNNGHTVQANIAEGSTLSSGISRYKLLQVHFHTPSEETIYGIHYPMVAHFVHIDYAGNYAVLGVLFEEGAHNPELDKLVKAAPPHERGPEVVSGVTFDPARLLPANLSVYRYEGSLTTPPCTEGVHWHVATRPVPASAAQIAAIHAIVGDNARPIQPLHGRLLVAGAE